MTPLRLILRSILLSVLLSLLIIAGLSLLLTTPCRDGSRSWSRGAGRCSHHGGASR